MEAVAAKVADGTESLSLVSRHNTLSCIFNHQKIMALCDIHNSVHLACNSGIMYRNDCPGTGSNGILNQFLINIHGIRADIHENRLCSPQNKSICRGHKGVGRHDDLISLFHIS